MTPEAEQLQRVIVKKIAAMVDRLPDSMASTEIAEVILVVWGINAPEEE